MVERMTNPRVRFRSGGRQSETLTVDYKDVLDQAVENERWAVLRELRRSLETIQVDKRVTQSYSYGTVDRSATEFKIDVLEMLGKIERGLIQ
jgi:hypothetical protein